MVRIGFDIGRIGTAKNFFLNTDLVKSKIDKTTRKNLTKIGAFIRKRARSSMRASGKSEKTQVSEPGKPPRYHTRLLKDRIFFIYEPREQAVIIGPELVRTKRGQEGNLTVPELLEFGGTVTRKKSEQRWVTREGKKKLVFDKPKTVKYHYDARPYMGPALDKERKNPKLMGAWKDSVR